MATKITKSELKEMIREALREELSKNKAPLREAAIEKPYSGLDTYVSAYNTAASAEGLPQVAEVVWYPDPTDGPVIQVVFVDEITDFNRVLGTLFKQHYFEDSYERFYDRVRLEYTDAISFRAKDLALLGIKHGFGGDKTNSTVFFGAVTDHHEPEFPEFVTKNKSEVLKLLRAGLISFYGTGPDDYLTYTLYSTSATKSELALLNKLMTNPELVTASDKQAYKLLCEKATCLFEANGNTTHDILIGYYGDITDDEAYNDAWDELMTDDTIWNTAVTDYVGSITADVRI